MKKLLLAYKINGKNLLELGTWSNDELNGNKPFIIINDNETIPNNYGDISTIFNWNVFGIQLVNDYLVCKDQIKIIGNEKGWSGLTTDERDLIIKYYAYTNPTDAIIHLMTAKGYTQQYAQYILLQQWHKHHGNLMNTAKQRWYYVKLIVPMYLSFLDSEDLLNTVEPLVFSYHDICRFGINYGDNKDGILDYIESTGIFTGQGLRENNYTLQTGTYDDFILAMKNVLLYGIYTKYDNFELD